MASGADYYKLLEVREKTENKSCLFFNCTNKSIDAHSIQKNKILSKLSENGEVIVFQHRNSVFGAHKKGKGIATTFTGFCSQHDGATFTAIEQKDFSPGEIVQEGLFAYRALATEMHAKKSAVNFFTALLFGLHTADLDLNHDLTRNALDGERMGLEDMVSVNTVFKTMVSSGNFADLITKTIIFEEEYGVAATSAITFPHDFEGNLLPHLGEDLSIPTKPLFITIFPQKGKTYVLLSHLSEHKDFYSFLNRQLLNKNPEKQKKLLSGLFMDNCGNMVFAPKSWNKLSPLKQKRFIEKFRPDVFSEPDPNFANSHFNIFLSL